MRAAIEAGTFGAFRGVLLRRGRDAEPVAEAQAASPCRDTAIREMLRGMALLGPGGWHSHSPDTA